MRVARVARPEARSILLAGLLALLWFGSPQARSQTAAWPFTAGGAINSSPAIGVDGTIYFGSSDGRLYAVHSNGALNWSFFVSGEVSSAPALASDETIYFGSTVGGLYAVHSNGSNYWRFPTGGIYSSPAVGVDGTIYVGSLDNKLYAVRPDGTNRWTFTTGGPIYSSPAVGVDGTIYVGSRDNRVYAVDRDGNRKWDFLTGGQVDSSPAIGTGGTIYVGSLDAKVYAFNPDGTTNWVYAAEDAIYSSPAVGPDGTIYVAARNGRVFAVRSDGKEIWRSQATQSEIGYQSIALAADGSLYLGAKDGLLRGLTSDGGSTWTLITTAPVSRSSPAIGPDGTIYIGSDDHKLYALSGGSPPAAGLWPMFRHDARHTANGFIAAVRQLPSDYSPGATISVSIETTPLPGFVIWAVDETPPSGWSVSLISDSGIFDAGSGTIRFGPFFDGQPRTLTYQVTSPLTETGVVQFAGTFDIGIASGWIAGNAFLRPIPLHPADQPLVDAWMTVGEVTAYGAAWKRNQGWPSGPSPILSPYLAQAISLWQSGEAYRYEPTAGPAPSSWVTLPTGVTPRYPAPPSASGSSPLGTAICIMPPNVQPGTNLTVVLNITPSTNAAVYAVEDQPPAGWAVSNITGGGLYDAKRGKVKWGPFFDTTPRPLSYSVAIPADKTDVAQFSGGAAFDDTQSVITGVRALFVGTQVSNATFSVHRILPRGYVPGQAMQVTDRVSPLADVDFVIVEDVVPTGWHVDPLSVSHRGVYSGDSTNGFDHTVRYGVYLDGQTRDLTYIVTPPTNSLNTVLFHGVALANETQIIFDDALPLSPLHPGDVSPTDNWMTIGELTTYGAAWKRGDRWGLPPPPQPIQPDYLIRGIELWYGGEHYDLDVRIPDAPFWWVNLTNAVAPGEVPIAIQPGSSAFNGTALVSMTTAVQPGGPITVTIISRPKPSVLNYALEDKPPEGWTVVPDSISYGGSFDALRGKVKWGPFFENTARLNSYQVTPPLDLDTNAVKFVGGAAFDGQTTEFIGDRSASPNLTNSFAVRHLPTNYSPGLRMTVTLNVNPPAGVSFYKIEDTVPAPEPERWIVSNISHDGVADISGVVRFGPFLDDTPRQLTYEVTPPLCGSGTKTFSGIAFADGSARLLVGDPFLDMAPLHPADILPVDGWVTIGEVTKYVTAWKDGTIWPCVGPDPLGLVRNDFLERAVELWLGGEHYGFDPAVTNAPLWWVNTTAAPTEQVPVAAQSDAVAGNGTAIASMPMAYRPGTNFTVTIAVTPVSSVIAYAVEDQPPAGWIVGAISEGGFLDMARGKVKWGPFSDSSPRTLSYEVTPPVGATNTVRFNGSAAFDNQQGAIGGQRFASPKPTDFFAVRHLPTNYSPGLRMTVVLDVNPPAGVSFYKIEDRVPSPSPELWTVSNISHDGVGVEDLGEVRFGPFLDDLPRRLTYELTAPLCVSGSKTLAGIAYADGSQRLLVGDYLLDMSPLHPADTNSVDGWVTIGEMTEYVTAWKVGQIWPCVGTDPPGRVRNDFLERAVEIWLGGEHYGFEPSVTNAPLWWVNLTNAVARQDVPIPVVPGSTTTSGTAVVSLPSSFLPGVPLSIRITATPGVGVSAYALEDQPPEGWTVLTDSISDGGRFDALRGKVKWGPFSDDSARTNSYQVIPPLDAGGVGRFVGGVAFDGQTADFIGPRETMRSGNPPPRFSSARLLSGGLELTLQGGGVGVFTLQRSTDLIGWTVVTNLPTSGGPVPFVDSSATNRTWTFYRAVWQ